MNPRFWFLPALATAGMSFSAFASTEQPESERTFYLGADWAAYNDVKLESGGVSISENSDFGDLGFNLVAGYEFNTHKVVKLGVEAEYRSFSEVNYEDVLKVEGSGFYINIKPKFIVQYDEADVYVSLLAGVGNMDIDAKAEGVSASESEASYQFGAELGFIINCNVDLHLGYRSAHVEVDNIDASVNTAYLGARYFF